MEAESDPDDDGGPPRRAEELEDLLGLERLYVDFEGRNPTGTHKDRIALAHVRRAVDGGFSGITVGTCGNYGAAIAYHASLYGLRAVVFVPASYTHERLNEIRRLGAEVIEVLGAYEDAVRASRCFARDTGLYDANPGGKREVDFEAYSTMALEILTAVRPDVVLVPVGNGTTLAGLWRGFSRLGVRPRMIGVTTSFGNEVLRRFYCDPRREFAETRFNEPLVSEVSFDGEEAMNAIRESDGYVFGFADDTAVRCSRLIYVTTGLQVLPASALTLAGLVKFTRKFGIRRGRFVLILTGGVRGGDGKGLGLNGGAVSDVRWKDRSWARALL